MAGNAPAKGKAKGGEDSGNKTKLIVAVIGLLLAGGLIAWHFGAFDSVADKITGNKPADPNAKITPEMKKAYEKQKKQLEKLQQEGKAPETAGS